MRKTDEVLWKIMNIKDIDPRADALTTVLDYLGMKGKTYRVRQVTSSRVIEETAGSRQISLYVIESGAGKIKFKASGKETGFGGGDLLLVGGGAEHVIYAERIVHSDSVANSIPAGESFGKNTKKDKRKVRRPFQMDEGGAPIKIIGGALSFKYPDNPHLTAALPPLIHISAENYRGDDALERLVALLFEESAGGAAEAGSGIIGDRLMEIIFVKMIRIWIKTHKKKRASWLGSLGDEKIGQALSLLHKNPEKGWTLDKLSAAVGKTKSPFCIKFTKLVGEPPIRYLTKWRMNLAAGYLQSGELNVGEVAARIGFTRDGFSQSFKTHFGRPPIDYKPK